MNPSTANRPKVSFYILAYNHQSMIRQAIEGALSQTYQPLEIIVSDDCSDDDTWQVIQQTLREHRGSHSILARRNERNMGISQHINEVWHYCSGDWIVASAGDDISLPERVESIMQVASANKAVKLVQSWVQEIDAEGHPLDVNGLGCDCAPGALRLYGLEDRIRGATYHPHGAAMAYSRDLVDRFSPLPEGVIFEDNIVNLRAELLGSAAVLARPLVKHRNHPGQVTRIAGIANEKKARQRIKLRLTSDIISSQQCLTDISASSENLPSNQYNDIANCYRRRLAYFSKKRKALIFIWPLRLIYLIHILAMKRVAPLSTDDFIYSLVPRPLHGLMQRLRSWRCLFQQHPL
ncbi:MAG: glycosyltransferase [Porticoccaceae bacterium]|nr:glycosyltransferase [Porticoccaceae bacterium]